MQKNNLTYKKSGVNIRSADKFVRYISSKLNKSKKSSKFNNIGGFGSVSRLPKISKGTYMVASTDGVGTKLEIANKLKKFDTIGIDLVAMSVNDLIVQGGKPFLFLDYISIEKINLKKLKSIINGIIKGCKLSDCELAGGETAEMPGTYTKGKFDLAGFAVGFVNKKQFLFKKKIKKNNLILAIPSNGLHSNGFTLVRNIIKKNNIDISKNKFLKNELIKPTKIYVKEILALIKKNLINGCANITGGGLKENIKRILPDGLCAEIDLKKIKTKEIFKWIKEKKIDDKEMIKTFNCGVGFCIIINEINLNKVNSFFTKKYKPYVIGKVIQSNKKTILNGKINW